MNQAEIDARHTDFASDEFVYNTTLQELVRGPGRYAQCTVLIPRPGAGPGEPGTWGSITGTLSDQGDLWTQLLNRTTIRITQTDAENSVDGSGAILPAAGRWVYTTDTRRAYQCDGIRTIAQLVGQGYFLSADPRTGKTLYVDATYGINSSAARERADRPYQTLTAAKAAALAGDWIVVKPGTYDETNLLKNGVNWWFAPGANVVYTGATPGYIFDDGPDGANADVVCTISGSGSFSCTNNYAAATEHFGIIGISRAGSRVTVNCHRIDQLSNNFQFGWTVVQQNGLLFINTETGIYSPNGAYNLGWFGGTAYINGAQLKQTGTAIQWAGTEVGGDWYVNFDQIESTAAEIVVDFATADTVGALWINSALIKAPASVGITSGSSGKVYITAQKIWNLDTAAPVVSFSGGSVWITVQKLTAASGQFFRCEAASGAMRLEVQQYESTLEGEVTSNYGSIYNEGADLTLLGGVMKITNAGETQRGLEHVDGTTLVKGMTFDLSGNDQSDSYPVHVQGAGLTLDNCVLHPPSGTPSVGGSSVSFKANGGTVHGPLQATVTASGNLFHDQGGPTAGQVPTANADGTWSWATPA